MRPLFATAALALALSAAPASAQISFSPVVGYTDGDFAFDGLSVGLAFELGTQLEGVPLQPSIRPLVEFVFADADVTYLRANGDLIGRFEASPGASFLPYAKAGVVLEYISSDNDFGSDFDDTNFGINLGGGAEFTRFFVEGELGLSTYSDFSVRAGYRF